MFSPAGYDGTDGGHKADTVGGGRSGGGRGGGGRGGGGGLGGWNGRSAAVVQLPILGHVWTVLSDLPTGQHAVICFVIVTST